MIAVVYNGASNKDNYDVMTIPAGTYAIFKVPSEDEDIRFGESKGDYLKFIGNVDFVSWCMKRFLIYKIMLDGKIIGTFWLDHETDDRPDHFES